MKETTNGLKCEIVRDLLPLYHDDVVSEVTHEEVKKHLESCEDCSAEYDAICSELPVASAEKRSTGVRFAKMMKRLRNKRVVMTACIALLTIGAAAGILYVLTSVPLATVPADQVHIYRAYNFDFSGDTEHNWDDSAEEKGLFIYYSMNTQYAANLMHSKPVVNGSTMELNFKVPIIRSHTLDGEKDEYTNIDTIPSDEEITEITVNGETIWKQTEVPDKIPDYVESYHDFLYNSKNDSWVAFDKYDKTIMGESFVLEREDGTIKAWDIDGNVLYDGKREDFWKSEDIY